MQVLVVLLLGAFIIGSTRAGRWLRDNPIALVAVCSVAAASYYSLGVIL
jgi:hypothetical protein